MSNILNNLNKEQKQAVLHEQGPAVVLAGAGSGKTTVLTARVAWLLTEKNIKPYEIFVVTFTNKAAKEIKERILQKTGFHLPWSGTFHSLCAKILRIDGAEIGLANNFVIYDADDQLSLIKKIFKDLNIDDEDIKPKSAQNAISQAKNEMLKPDDYEQIAKGHFQQTVAKIYKIYQRELNKASAVDFDDLLLKTVDLLKKSARVKEKFQKNIKHVLVDEYQDTNKVQYTLTKLLAEPQNNIFVVGDFCQSIYAWRGADYKNMMQLKTSFPDIKEYKLEQNYRSNQTILTAATEVISQNTMHPVLNLWTERTEDELIEVFEADNGRSEADHIAKFLEKKRDEYKYSQMAVLYRTNAQSREFEEAFMRFGIPYKLIGGVKFYERKEVKDVLAYLRFAVNKEDSVSQDRIVKLGKRIFSKFSSWLEKLQSENKLDTLTDNPALVIKDILEVTGYIDKYNKKTEEDLARKENVKELINVASQFENANQFLENIALIQDSQFVDKETEEVFQDAVNMMSLHSAKGLEFDVVCLVGLEDGLLPHTRSLYDEEQMEEERRLCYVGITRAKNKLHLSFAKSRYQYGSNMGALKSRFLDEIPTELLSVKKEIIKHENNYGQYNYGKNNFYNNNHNFTKKQNQNDIKYKERQIVVDDDILDGVLSGDFDIEKLINS